MTTSPQPRSRAEVAAYLIAWVIRIVAAGFAAIEMIGPARAAALGFAAFMLTVAQSLESSAGSFFGGKQGSS